MAQRSKRLVRKRSGAHKTRVKAKKRMRKTRASRGMQPAPKRRRTRAARRTGRGMRARVR